MNVVNDFVVDGELAPFEIEYCEYAHLYDLKNLVSHFLKSMFYENQSRPPGNTLKPFE